MNRLTLIIWTVAFVMICHLQGTAQNLVTPPSGLPQERWELTYNDYRAPIYEQSLGYFQSITADYPRIRRPDKPEERSRYCTGWKRYLYQGNFRRIS